MSTSGFTIARAFSTVWANRYSQAKIKRSALLNVFFNDTSTTEIYTLSLHDALPISNEAGDRNNPTNAVQIRLQASFIGQKDCVILHQLSARLSLRQGQAYF